MGEGGIDCTINATCCSGSFSVFNLHVIVHQEKMQSNDTNVLKDQAIGNK